MSEIININLLLKEATTKELYVELVKQLNKDLLTSNIDYTFSLDLTPELLKKQLYEVVYQLINTQFDDFLNLLYRIDVSEKKLKGLPEESIDTYVVQVSFLILKREWQKVWLRKKHG